MKRPEQALQHAVIDVLNVAGVPGLFWFAVPNGGWRSPIEAKILKGLGLKAGVHDLILCIPPTGRMAGLELKAPKGVTSEAQTAVHLAVNLAGGFSRVARDLEEVIFILDRWGAIRPDRLQLQSITIKPERIKRKKRTPAAGE